MDTTPTFAVCIDERGQFALHPANRRIPAGWRADGFVGDEAACIRHVDTSWVTPPRRALQHAREDD